MTVTEFGSFPTVRASELQPGQLIWLASGSLCIVVSVVRPLTGQRWNVQFFGARPREHDARVFGYNCVATINCQRLGGPP